MAEMTRKTFKYNMRRGLGSCAAALKNMQDEEKEKFQPLVLWGCSRDMAYDAQCEGCRSAYLHELILEFPDVEPFIDVITKRLFLCMGSTGWEFLQDCQLLAYFVSDGVRRAWHVLTKCYELLLETLSEKRNCAAYGQLRERNNFESLCIALVSQCFEDRERREKLYQKVVRDLGFLAEDNELYDVSDFYWFQTVCEDCLGKKTVHRLLHRADADEHTKTYAHLMESYQNTWEEAWRQHRREEPETAEMLYGLMRNGEIVGRMWTPVLARRWLNQDKDQEVLQLAGYYREENDPEVRYQLLRLLATEVCARMLDLTRLIEDSKSEHSELSRWAFEALAYRTDEKVRAYALELLQSGTHTARAVSMLAANYEDRDKELFVCAVKQIPITYGNGEWHGVFKDVMDLFDTPGGKKPKELLPYMYRNTLCSFCRECVVKEMGRRRMLTQELLEEMRYDCNQEIGRYADKKLSRSALL